MAKFIQFMILQLSLLLIAGPIADKPKRQIQQFNVAAKGRNNVKTVSDVVSAATRFKSTLSGEQIAILQKTFTKELAEKWSNLPCGSNCRNGIAFNTLNSIQLDAANRVIESAAGSVANEGFDEFTQIRLADDYLDKIPADTRRRPSAALRPSETGPGGFGGPQGPAGRPGPGGPGGKPYSSGAYFISFLGEPSSTGRWMLQFGGHHYAANITFNNGEIVGVTPIFEGVEPTSFEILGKTYAPLEQEHTAMVNMLSSLTAQQLMKAKSRLTFSDVLLGPGQDGNFPASKAGLNLASLTLKQKALVLEAMKPWLRDVDKTSAAKLLSTYQKQLDQTFIAFTGKANTGVSSSFLNANTDYVRIDGPSVWIEFVCQSGVVLPGQIHYHTVWRDHLKDYGSSLTNNDGS